MEGKPKFSTRFSAGTRVYYVDVRIDKREREYISISEIPTDGMPGRKSRQRIFIHSENLERFKEAFDEACNFIKGAKQ